MDIFNTYNTITEIHDNELTFKVVLPKSVGLSMSPETVKNIESLVLSYIDDVLIYTVNKDIYFSDNKIKSTFANAPKVSVIRQSISLFKKVFYRTCPGLMSKEELHEVEEILKYCERIENK